MLVMKVLKVAKNTIDFGLSHGGNKSVVIGAMLFQAAIQNYSNYLSDVEV
jgi:hypothetical protein